jgi:hypothetical protein
MSNRMSAGWPEFAPTADQLKEFFAQIASGRISGSRLQRFMTEKFFTFPVDFDDPRWKKLPAQGEHTRVNPNVWIENFPVRFSGRAKVTVELVQYDHEISIGEHFELIEGQDALYIDRPITETFHEFFPAQRNKGWILSPCGTQLELGGEKYIASISANDKGIVLQPYPPKVSWDQREQFLVLRGIKPLAA